MARLQNRLNVKSVKALTAPGMHADGGGLYLRITPAGSRTWAFVYQWQGARKQISLGPCAVVSLGDARDRRDEARRKVASGIDPAATAIEVEDAVTFGQAAEALIDSLEHSWKNPKHRQQWRNTLKTHCAAMWDKRVDAIETKHVVDALTPIWVATPETAVRLRGRIERVLDAAKVKGQRSGDNPARWRGHLEVILSGRKKRGAVKHHPALPYPDTPAFVRSLKGHFSMAARALEFLILTAARTNEVLGMTWSEVDLEAKLWIVPADRMKMGVEHRVPLSPAAVIVLEAMRVFGDDPDAFVFPGRKPGSKLSNMAMEMLLRRMNADTITVHGFRSTFRDCVDEKTETPREIAEAALAHQVGSEVERAYRRGDALAKRRVLMDAWGEFVAGGAPKREAGEALAPAASQRSSKRRRSPAANPLQTSIFESDAR